jgi:thioredoxin reductase (NADPH)
MSAEAVHDVVVIGAGAAGVSAAIECFDIQLDVVVLDAANGVGGQIEQIPHAVRNVAPAPMGNDALVDALTIHASILGDRLRLDVPVTRLDLDNGLVVAGTHRFVARSVLLATGSRRREREDAPEGSFGGDVTYLVEPHLTHFVGRRVAVVGGGDSAALDALTLAHAGSSVLLLYRSDRLKARRDLVERLESEKRITQMAGWAVDNFVGSDRLVGVDASQRTTGERQRLDVGGAILKLGREPCVELVRDQVDCGPRGGIVVDAELRTSHPRAFAAGDVVEGAYERIATATGQGALAARSMLHHLESDR